MARERLDVRQIRDVLRLHFLGTSRNKIAGSLGIGRNTVSDYLGRVAISGIRNFTEVSGLDDVELERRLGFWRGHTHAEKRDRDKPLPDFLNIHNELRRDGVTLRLLWEEYLAENPKGYKYSQFAERYCKWKRKLSVVMRQTHRGGEKSFVDYCNGVFITDAVTGEKNPTQLFVGVLGASSYTYAEATLTQSLPDWLGVAAEDSLPGIFSGCQHILSSLAAAKGDSYREEARRLGITNSLLIEEYVRRRTRDEYLELQLYKNISQFEATFDTMNKIWSNVLFADDEAACFASIRKTFRNFSGEWFPQELRGRDAAPLPIDLLSHVTTKAQLDRISEFAEVWTGLAYYRHLISRAFVQLPKETLSQTVQELPRETLMGVYNGHFFNLHQAIHQRPIGYTQRLRPILDRRDRTSMPAETRRSLTILAFSIMRNTSVSESVRSEINQEMNFMNKYDFPFHPFFIHFLLLSADYFSIPRN